MEPALPLQMFHPVECRNKVMLGPRALVRGNVGSSKKIKKLAMYKRYDQLCHCSADTSNMQLDKLLRYVHNDTI